MSYAHTISVRRIPEHRVEDKPLGRHVVHDSRSLAHPARTAGTIVSVRHTSIGLPLDQGNIGSCTANALIGCANTQPNQPRWGPWTERGAVRLYQRETLNEGHPYPPEDPGGSGLEVCKAAVQLGIIRSYAHAFGLQHALSALALGPVITGVDWYDSFDEPDADGLVAIRPGATIRGGHEFMADEIDVDRGRVGFTNSWGPGYGIEGRFYMGFDTWRALLAADGDVTVPVF